MIPFKNLDLPPVTQQEMEAIYDRIRTPFKYGPVLKMENDYTDSPSVFFHDGKWYMYYISIAKDVSASGYETHLAVSSDLLHWEQVGTIFRRNDENHWDSRQCAGYAAFMDPMWGGTNMLQRVNGKYYISYLAGNSDGYEPDPLYMGLAYSDSPIHEFTRLPEPILKPEDPDSRHDETKTLYRSFLFEDAAQITGYPYVNVYNGKDFDDRERIFCAVSQDAEHWERYGDRPLIDEATGDPEHIISGDPQIFKIGSFYVMFYFKYNRKGHAFENFACSRDFVNWTIWQGQPLIAPSENWDARHAHKPWVVQKDGVVYHYYCACNDNRERFIALATSRKV